MSWLTLSEIRSNFIDSSWVILSLEGKEVQPSISKVLIKLDCSLEELSRLVNFIFSPEDFANCQENVWVTFVLCDSVSAFTQASCLRFHFYGKGP